ncbi:MAG: TIGR01440 family protein [Oscillospiraceae bacterium]|jgi:uncharacterized protein (TIGR01440 family)|nr:TIGR01440 family protein [Oscillospiraceae bacterium]
MAEVNLKEIEQQTRAALTELLQSARLSRGDILVVGCSSSEVAGKKIGTASSREIAQAILSGISPELKKQGIYLAAQCCEHLNRVLIVDQSVVKEYGLEQVNVMPVPGAGGSFASAAYEELERPVAVESVAAHAGMDIGNTLIGMHLRPVAVPVRVAVDKIGMAQLVCARTRPKFVGGARAVYNDSLL